MPEGGAGEDQNASRTAATTDGSMTRSHSGGMSSAVAPHSGGVQLGMEGGGSPLTSPHHRASPRNLEREVQRSAQRYTYTDEFSDHTTVADFTNLPSELPTMDGESSNSMGKTEGQRYSQEGSYFAHCILPSAENNYFSLNQLPPPRRSGPCNADMLRHILTFVDGNQRSDVIEFGGVCKFWRYHANFAPHWSVFRRREWSTRSLNVPRNVRTMVSRPRLVTREEYIEERKLLRKYHRDEVIVGYTKYVRWCVSLGLGVAVMLAVNITISFCIGFFPSPSLSNDATLGTTVFIVMLLLSAVETAVIAVPLGGTADIFPDGMKRMSHLLSWCELLVGLSVVFGVVTALAFVRVRSVRDLLDHPVYNMTQAVTNCTESLPSSFPGFVTLPALLTDIRWRPITTDPKEMEYQPYCVGKYCFSLLYFDRYCESSAFQDASGYAGRNVGTYKALGYDVFECSRQIIAHDDEVYDEDETRDENETRDEPESTKHSSLPGCGPWCEDGDRPPVVAVPMETFVSLSETVEANYPTLASWLGYSKSGVTGDYTYRASSNARYVGTETQSGSTNTWRKHSSLWQDGFIPLVADVRLGPEYYRTYDQHYRWYAGGGFIISGVLWLVMLLAQCIFRTAGMGLLGISTCVMVLFLNPLTMIVSGALCVTMTDYYTMCSESAGGGLIGGGVSLTLVLFTVYFSL